MTRQNRNLVDILDQHERDIRRLKQSLSRIGGGSFLPLAGGTMAGDINLGDFDLLAVDNIIGSAATSLNIYGGAGATGGRLEIFSGTAGGGNANKIYYNADEHIFRDADGTPTLAVLSAAAGLNTQGYNVSAGTVFFGGQSVYGLDIPTGGAGGDYGTVRTTGTGLNSYEGYSINGDFVFMSNSSSHVGIYNDTANFWLLEDTGTDVYLRHSANGEELIRGTINGSTYLYHNDVYKIATVAGGVDVQGRVTFSGVDNWGIDGADDFGVFENGAVRFRIRDDYNDGYHEFLGTSGTVIATISTDDFSVKGAVRAGLGTESTLTAGYFYGIIPTTGSAANAYWAVASGSTYYALRYSSSARYKTDIKPFKGKLEGKELSVLDLTPTIFRGSEGTPAYEDIPEEELKRDKHGVVIGDTYFHKKDKDGHFLYRHDFNDYLSIGLTAEDVAEVFPPGAVLDEAGRPESIDWNNVNAGLLYEVQQLRKDVDRLNAKNGL